MKRRNAIGLFVGGLFVPAGVEATDSEYCPDRARRFANDEWNCEEGFYVDEYEIDWINPVWPCNIDRQQGFYKVRVTRITPEETKRRDFRTDWINVNWAAKNKDKLTDEYICSLAGYRPKLS